MKKWTFPLVGLGLLAGSAQAAISTPYVAGSHQGWVNNSDAMTETSLGSGVFTRSYTGLTAGNRYEFKITNGTWDTTIPAANSWFFADANGDITITYDSTMPADGWLPANDRLGVSDAPVTWTAAGSFQTELGAAGDWNNAEPLAAMTPVGGGVYQLNAVLPAGTYDWKAVVTGSWDAIGLDGRNINAGNITFTVADGETAQMSVNALTGAARVQVVPEPAAFGLIGLGALAMLRRRSR